VKLRNPCKKCIVKIMCTEECESYEDYKYYISYIIHPELIIGISLIIIVPILLLLVYLDPF